MTQIVPDGLVAHWRLDETSGTVAVDQTGNNDLTYDGVSLPSHSVRGKVGRAIDFGAPSGDASAFADNDISPIASTGNFTVTGWIRYEGEPEDSVHGILELPGYFRIRKGWQSLGLQFRPDAWDESATKSGPNIPIGKWMHFAISYSYNDPIGTDPDFYLNGEFYPVGSGWGGTLGGSYSAPTDHRIRLARRYDSSGSTFQGVIDDIRIYNRILDPEEIREIFEARDGVRYNKTYRVPEFFDGNQWVAMPPSFPDVTDGLVGHWKLDEKEGTFFDSSGNDNHGTQVNDVTYAVQGAVGRAAAFNAPNQRIEVPHHSSLTPTEDATFSFWVRPNDLWDNSDPNVWRIIDKQSSASINDAGWIIYVNGHFDGVLWFAVGDGGSATQYGTSSFTDWEMDRWYHVTVVYEQNGSFPTVSVYRDGVFANSSTASDPFTPEWGTDVLRLGRGYYNGDVFAALDDVRIYHRALSEDEIQALYRMGTPEGSSTALPQGCPEIGDVCDDGTIYAGESPDGNVPMFTTPEDAGRFYFATSNQDGLVNTAATSSSSGSENTRILMATDADSDTPGFQHHEGALYCSQLEAHGAIDWYVPAGAELSVMCDNQEEIGDFNNTGGYGHSSYLVHPEQCFRRPQTRSHEAHLVALHRRERRSAKSKEP